MRRNNLAFQTSFAALLLAPLTLACGSSGGFNQDDESTSDSGSDDADDSAGDDGVETSASGGDDGGDTTSGGDDGETTDDCPECIGDPGKTQDCYEGPANTEGNGMCVGGLQVCDDDGMAWGTCVGQVLPGTESCNGMDDNCDGDVDEICDCDPDDTQACYTGPANTQGVGPCAAGTQTCDSEGKWGDCTGDTVPAAAEICINDVDDDCNMTKDDGCVCNANATEPCYTGPAGTEGVGNCGPGTRTCNTDGSMWGPCNGDTLPATDTCDDEDNDCDGAIDEFSANNTECMVDIPSGSFSMGCKTTAECWLDDTPIHLVTLSSYRLDKMEVTQAAWDECVQNGPCTLPAGCTNYDPVNTPDHPMACTSWWDADTYCSWVGKRLPTEAEWEFAARGTASFKYPWGDTPEPDCTLTNFGSCATSADPVGSFPTGVSSVGAFDMASNVLEWVNDWLDETYYQSSPANNPPGPVSGTDKVFRGSGWGWPLSTMRSSYRNWDLPDSGFLDVGFRCAQSVLNCGWDASFGFYECGFSGADPSGTWPMACPGGLVDGAACGGLTIEGCCDQNGDNWWCSGSTLVHNPC